MWRGYVQFPCVRARVRAIDDRCSCSRAYGLLLLVLFDLVVCFRVFFFFTFGHMDFDRVTFIQSKIIFNVTTTTPSVLY